MNGATRVNGVPLHDAYNQYLAYHEGKAGYARGSYRKKAWLPAGRPRRRGLGGASTSSSCRPARSASLTVDGRRRRRLAFAERKQSGRAAMDRLTEMEAFVQVVDHGGFTDAARKMGLSKSAVSKHVSALEARLAVRLLNRTTRRVSPTEVGLAYYDRARSVLAEARARPTAW